MSTEYIEATERDGILILKILPNELRETEECYATRDQMQAKLTPITNRVVIDMSNIRFVGSIGLLAFLGLRRAAPEARLIICNLDPSVLEMLILCRLVAAEGTGTGPFEVRATLDDAISELAS